MMKGGMTYYKCYLIIIFLAALLIISGCNLNKPLLCYEKDSKCCNGLTCATSYVDCIQGSTPEFIGCNDKCIPEYICKKVE